MWLVGMAEALELQGYVTSLLKVPTTIIPFVRCNEKRCFAKRLAAYIGKLGDSDTAPLFSLSLLLFADPYDRL